MQANQTAVILTMIACSAILLAAGVYGIAQIPSVPEIGVMPTAAEIAALVSAGIVIPEAAVTDSAKVNRVCELTEGCEFYKIDFTITGEVLDFIDGGMAESLVLNGNAQEDFEEALSDLLNIDEEYFNIIEVEIKDAQVRAYTENDKEDGNYEVKAFVRVGYKDIDDLTETEVIYLLITSTLDEGVYDSLSVEEVSRNFEF